jgi:glycosyltransferase involved in cell wall biosynthesis
VTVLFAVESMERAGAEQVVLSLVRGLDRKRFRPVVCCLTERGELAELVEAEGVPVEALHKHPHFDLPVVPRLWSVLKKYDVRILHSHVWPANVWGRVVGRAAGGLRLVVTEHNVDLWKRKPHFAVDRFLARFTNRIVCVSRAVEGFYRDVVGVPQKKLVYVPNGIDPEPFARSIDVAAKRRSLSVEPDERVVAIVARLIPQKDHGTLLNALKKLDERGVGARCLVVGDGALRADLEKRARELELEGRVRFLGERRDVAEVLLASDVAVLSSIHEGMPLAVLEAMAAAKPVVVTDVGGNREVVRDGETGIVVPPGDPGALSDALARLLTSSEVARKMGAAGRERVLREFSLIAMVKRNEEIYEEDRMARCEPH